MQEAGERNVPTYATHLSGSKRTHRVQNESGSIVAGWLRPTKKKEKSIILFESSDDSDFDYSSSGSSDSECDDASADTWSDYEDPSWIKDQDADTILLDGSQFNRAIARRKRRVSRKRTRAKQNRRAITIEIESSEIEGKGKKIQSEETHSEYSISSNSSSSDNFESSSENLRVKRKREEVIAQLAIRERIRGDVALNIRRSPSDQTPATSPSAHLKPPTISRRHRSADDLLEQASQRLPSSSRSAVATPSASPKTPGSGKRSKLSDILRSLRKSPERDHSTQQSPNIHTSAPALLVLPERKMDLSSLSDSLTRARTTKHKRGSSRGSNRDGSNSGRRVDLHSETSEN